MSKAGMVAAAAMIVAAPGVALAQYRPEAPSPGFRPGQPPVNSAPVRRDPDASANQVANDFRRWYVQARKPSLLIFWNRELTDEATTEYAEVKTAREDIRGKRTATGNHDASVQAEDDSQSKLSTSETVRRRVTGGTYAPLDKMLSAQLESAFQGTWLLSGAELVDRTALVRKMSTVASQADRSDTQFMESLALEQGVDYLVEILPNPSASSPTGLVFLVKIKHLPSSTMIAQFNTPAQPAAGDSYWVAGSSGFERQRDDRTNPETIGATLAVQTMQKFLR